MIVEHSKGPWREGAYNSIVSDDVSGPMVPGAEMVEHYGGYMVAESVADGNRRRIVACVNACASIPTYQLIDEEFKALDLGAVIDSLRADRDRTKAKIDWLQKVNGLHRSFETLYVVDGYHVTITWDGEEISKPFHGKTLDLAIEAAMAGYDLDAKPQFIDNPAEPECMLETNAKLLNALQALALFTKPTKSNAVVLNNAYQVISSATELSPPQPETFPKYIQFIGRIKRPDANQHGDAEGGAAGQTDKNLLTPEESARNNAMTLASVAILKEV